MQIIYIVCYLHWKQVFYSYKIFIYEFSLKWCLSTTTSNCITTILLDQVELFSWTLQNITFKFNIRICLGNVLTIDFVSQLSRTLTLMCECSATMWRQRECYLQHGNQTAGGGGGVLWGQFMDNSVMAGRLRGCYHWKALHTPRGLHVVSRTSPPDRRLTVYSLMCVLSLAFRQLETGSANTLHREKKNYDSS